VGNSGYFIRRDLMYLQAVCEHQDIDICEVGCIKKFGGETSWKMDTQKTEDDDGSITVIWDVTLCSIIDIYEMFGVILMHEK
jgi:hypothetical protein